MSKIIQQKGMLIISKETILATTDYNLSGDRYRTTTDYTNAKWPMVELGEIMVINFGERITKSKNLGTEYPVYGGGGESFRTDRFNRENEYVIARFAMGENCFRYVQDKFWMMDSGGTFSILDNKKDLVLKEYIGKVLLNIQNQIFNCARGNAQKNLNNDHFYKIEIPLPPLEVQERIVAEIDGYQNIIDGAKQVVANWKPKIDIDPEWEMVKLGEVCEINPKKAEVKNIDKETLVSFVPMSDIKINNSKFTAIHEKMISEVLGSYTYFKDNDVLIARVTPCFENGKAGIAKELKNGIGFGSSEYTVIRPGKKILSEIIFTLLTNDQFRSNGKTQMTGTGGLQRVPNEYFNNFSFSLPPLSIQNEIVERIECERKLVESAKELVIIYEEKIKNVIQKVWN